MIFLEYAIDVADACRARGIKTVAVTAGYVCPEPRAEFYAHMDAANVDLKAFSERLLPRASAPGSLRPVLDTLEYLKHETDVWFEMTTLLIPGENDSDAELDAVTALGASSTSGRTSRCTSPRSIPTTGCSTGRRRRAATLTPGPGDRPARTASATPTRATSTTGRAAAPAATGAARS